jgi:hypothetical protein
MALEFGAPAACSALAAAEMSPAESVHSIGSL